MGQKYWLYLYGMKAATVHDIKQGLQDLSAGELTELCLRLVKFKKDNKELVSYILFDAQDLDGYLAALKKEMAMEFAEINTSQVYFAKKSLRRILRNVNKQARYIGSKPAEVELLLAYCELLKGSGLLDRRAQVIEKLYEGQVAKIRKLIKAMHEDLQYDYEKMLQKLLK